MPRRDLFTSVWDESVRMLELPLHGLGEPYERPVRVCRVCVKLYESGPFRTRVSPFPRKEGKFEES